MKINFKFFLIVFFLSISLFQNIYSQPKKPKSHKEYDNDARNEIKKNSNYREAKNAWHSASWASDCTEKDKNIYDKYKSECDSCVNHLKKANQFRKNAVFKKAQKEFDIVYDYFKIDDKIKNDSKKMYICDTTFKKGDDYFLKGKYQDAINSYKKVDELMDRNYSSIKVNKAKFCIKSTREGDSLFNLFKYNEAAKKYDLVLKKEYNEKDQYCIDNKKKSNKCFTLLTDANNAFEGKNADKPDYISAKQNFTDLQNLNSKHICEKEINDCVDCEKYRNDADKNFDDAKYDDAIKFYDEVVKINDKDKHSENRIIISKKCIDLKKTGLEKFKLADYQESFNAYNEICSTLNPKDIFSCNKRDTSKLCLDFKNKADTLFKQGIYITSNNENAKYYYNEVVKINNLDNYCKTQSTLCDECETIRADAEAKFLAGEYENALPIYENLKAKNNLTTEEPLWKKRSAQCSLAISIKVTANSNFESGQYDTAITKYNIILAKDFNPNDPIVIALKNKCTNCKDNITKAENLFKEGNYLDAKKSYEDVLKVNEKQQSVLNPIITKCINYNNYFKNGVKNYNKNEWQLALNEFKNIINPNDKNVADFIIKCNNALETEKYIKTNIEEKTFKEVDESDRTGCPNLCKGFVIEVANGSISSLKISFNDGSYNSGSVKIKLNWIYKYKYYNPGWNTDVKPDKNHKGTLIYNFNATSPSEITFTLKENNLNNSDKRSDKLAKKSFESDVIQKSFKLN